MPFIARWPGKIKAGRVDETTMISAVDLLPTFCEVAGVTLEGDYVPDGVSQLAALTGEARPGREKPLFWKMKASWPGAEKKPYHWVSYAVADKQWKLLDQQGRSTF